MRVVIIISPHMTHYYPGDVLTSPKFFYGFLILLLVRLLRLYNTINISMEQ